VSLPGTEWKERKDLIIFRDFMQGFYYKNLSGWTVQTPNYLNKMICYSLRANTISVLFKGLLTGLGVNGFVLAGRCWEATSPN